MNNILLMGLTDHEAAAVEIMIGMNWRDHRCITLKRELSLAIPAQNAAARACGACVIDLFGLGMRKYSPESEQRLLEVLTGRSAVLLTWGEGGGWLEAKPALAEGQRLVWVSMPYTSAELREAIKKVKAATDRKSPTPTTPPARPVVPAQPRPRVSLDVEPDWPSAPAPAPVGTPAIAPAIAPAPASTPAWRRAMELAEQLKRKAAPLVTARPAPAPPPAPSPASRTWPSRPATSVSALPPAPPPPPAPQVKPAPPPAPAPAPQRAPILVPQPLSMAPPPTRMAAEAVGLGRGALKALLNAFPQLREQPLVKLAEQIVAHDGPMLLRIGNEAAFVTHIRAGWLASGLPVTTLLKLLHTPTLVEGIRAEPLDPAQVEETVRQHFDGKFHRAQKPLDVITWELMSEVLRAVPLRVDGDLRFQLKRFPNFTMLGSVGPIDVQLAAICARMPQSVSELLRAFPKHEQDVLRFVVLCVISGLAKVLPGAPQAAVQAAATAPAPVARKPEVAARRGFFKSLLDKLF